jgi:hypothetical protein
MFEHFVGRMQPVLSQAKKILLGNAADIGQLEAAIQEAEKNVLSRETYLDEEAMPTPAPTQRLSPASMVSALEMLRDVRGASLSMAKDKSKCTVSVVGMKRVSLGLTLSALEQDTGLIPLNPSNSTMREISNALGRGQEGLPLVVASAEQGSFRASRAFWVANGLPIPIETSDQLIALVAEWDGTRLDSVSRHSAFLSAQQLVEARVADMEANAFSRCKVRDDRQLTAASNRLALAIARTLAAQVESHALASINKRMFELMERKGSAGKILEDGYAKLGSYPTLPPQHIPRVATYIQPLTKAKRDAAASLVMVSAALNDPRWRLMSSSGA